MTPHDREQLAQAVVRLEQQSFAVTLANKMGMPLEALIRKIPAGARGMVERAVNHALQHCLKVAITGLSAGTIGVPHNRAHKLLTAATGATGGFFGIGGLLFELPVSTTLMLHSIAEIAKCNGEDLRQPEAALSCLEVFALGRNADRAEVVESAYFATRAAVAQATREAAAYITEKGLSKTSAPALVRFLSNIAARFGVEVGEKAAAQLVPIAGAVGGLTLNLMFTAHFQRLAEGHFTVRRLERMYGPQLVRAEYEKLRLSMPGSQGPAHFRG